MTQRWWFPFAVFLALQAATFAAIALFNLLTRPGEIPASRGVVASADADFDPAAIDRYAREFMQRTRVRGMTIVVVRGERTLLTASYGRGVDGAALTPQTPMPLASLSKSMTAAAAMRLVEAGALDLDAPLQSTLPAFDPADARGRRLTIRHLLNQSSGLPDLDGHPYDPSLDALLARASAARFVAEPGELWAYDNANYVLLAAALEAVADAPFAELMTEHVFAPLGMGASAAYPTSDDPASPVARGFRLLYGAALPARAPRGQLLLGGGDVASSADDLARWLAMQNIGETAAGESFLLPASLAAMHEPSAPGGEYGFGWRTRTRPDGTLFRFHVGRDVAYVAYEALIPETGFGYAIAWNTLHPFGAEQAAFIEGVYALLSGAEPQPVWRIGFIADAIAAALTALVASIGVVGVARARALIARRAVWMVVLRSAPYALAAAVGVLFPSQWFGVGWSVLLHVWPAFAALLAATVLAAFAVLGVRAAWFATLSVRRPAASLTPP
jgi:CubicO group peptidase (beta-lactamase class C family)